ncbi:MAG: rRNA methylase [Planctomycetaceae bacterium]|nr:rRNA methylase [Planctomycetaceae bacterium]
MPLIPIADLNDPRLQPFRQMKDRRLARSDGLFIAEGANVVDQLTTSTFQIHALLTAERFADRYHQRLPPDTPIYVLPEPQIEHVIGFKFHRGVIAAGRRQPLAALDHVMAQHLGQTTWLICPQIYDAENLGALIRIAAAFGVDGLILGPTCSDPLWRRTIRVSMGAVFHLPIVQSDDLERDLQRLHDQFNLTRIATVLDDAAQPLAATPRPDRVAILLGNEAIGLPSSVTDICDAKVTIPMNVGADSLNVAVAAAVCLYHFTQAAPANKHVN